MVIDSKFSASIASIKELLESSEKFIVPKFQRNYSWDVEKVEELWNDLVENYETIMNKVAPNEEAQYLLGPMVLLKSEKSSDFFVIDGQQRLATLTMLFCVARDVIMEDAISGDDSDRRDVEKAIGVIHNLIQVTELGEHKGWKLVLNDTDRDLFETVQKFEHDEEATQVERINQKFKAKSLENMKVNYKYLHDRITCAAATNFSKDPALCERILKMGREELRERRRENLNNLMRFVLFVAEYNFVIKVILKEDASAFQVFETLNTRGITLAKSNLIKNHVLNKVGSGNRELQDSLSFKWNRIFDELIGQGQNDDVFVMESLRSRRTNPNEGISKKNIYKVIKKKIAIEDPHMCKKFVSELEEDASFLAKLNDPTQYDDPTTRDEIDAIQILNAQSVRFPILTAYRKWCTGGKYDERYRDLIKVLVKFFFKYRTVRRKHPGDIEAIMSEVASVIYNGASSIRDIRIIDGRETSVMKILRSNDDHGHFMLEFENEFVIKPVKKSAKYVLQQITLKLGTKYDDVKPIDGLTLEHILPHNYDESWKREEFFKDSSHMEDQDMGKFVHRLGNMTLLKHAINSKLKDACFEDKKNSIDKETGMHDGYLASNLAINKKTVCNVDAWTASVIKEREKYFKSLADHIWSLDDK